MLTLPNKVYDAVKYLVLIAIPAFSTAYLGIDAAVDLPNEDAVVKILAVVAALLGTLAGIASTQYRNSDARFDGIIDPVAANSQTSRAALNMKTDEYDAANQKEVVFKVKQYDDVPDVPRV